MMTYYPINDDVTSYHQSHDEDRAQKDETIRVLAGRVKDMEERTLQTQVVNDVINNIVSTSSLI